MKKIIMIITIFFAIVPITINAYEIEDLLSEHVIIYNVDEDKLIYEKNSEEVTSIASLTKIMTTIVAIENIKDLKSTVIITDEMLEGIPWDASIAYLEVGEEVTYEDLLYGVMLPSGADAAQALAISLTGSVDNFVKKMNEKSKDLEMINTNFVNTSGLDVEGHYSTANDILKLLLYSLKNDTFKEVYQTKEYIMSNNYKCRSTLKYINDKLGNIYNFDYVLGSKTGNTDDAGVCLSTLSNIDDTNIVTITIKAPIEHGKANHLEDLNTIYENLNKDFDRITFVKEKENVVTLETKYAKEKKIDIKSSKEISRYLELPYEKEKLNIVYDGEEKIKYNIKKGTKVGKVSIYYGDELIDEIDAIIEEDLHFSFINYILSNLLWIIIIFIILILLFKIKRKLKRRKRRI